MAVSSAKDDIGAGEEKLNTSAQRYSQVNKVLTKALVTVLP